MVPLDVHTVAGKEVVSIIVHVHAEGEPYACAWSPDNYLHTS